MASVLFALLGAASAGVIAAAAAHVPSVESLPDWAGYVAYGAVPSFGVLALFTGIAGRSRSRRRWMARIGIAVGALLVLAALVALVGLVNALRTLG